MHTVTIQLSNEHLEMIKKLFQNEPNFQPQTSEDYVLVEILRQIAENSVPIEQ